LTVDGYSAQALAFECLKGTHTLLLFIVLIFTANEFISRKAV
jgi:hypothetical protein